MEDLKGSDQVLVVALVINSETVSAEEFDSLRKLFVSVRGQALFLDFWSRRTAQPIPILKTNKVI